MTGLTGVVGHGRPGHVHDVEGDDGGLEETGAGLGLLEGSKGQARQEVIDRTGSEVTLTCTLGRTAMTDTAMQNSRLRLMKTLCSTQSSGWV